MSASIPQPTRTAFDEVMVPTYAPPTMIPVRGEGSRVWDQEGREYIDFACGIAVSALGHCHPRLLAALDAQAHRLWHVANIVTNEPALRLAKTLVAATFAERVFFCNSGAEANEAALKLARRRGNLGFGTHKHRIITCLNAFHGRTLFTVTAGGQPKYSQDFAPLPPGITHVPFNDPAALEQAMGDDVCAVLVEPVQGEGGVTPATEAYLRHARELCDRHDALLMFDEVQTGVGRSGKLYAYQHYGVVPDVLTTAKGLGGGFPIGAMLCSAAAAEWLAFGTHGSTFGGNPLGCAVAEAVLAEVDQPEVLAGVEERGAWLREGLERIASRHGVFGAPRGLGLLIGAPLTAEWQGRARDLVACGLRHGVWMLVAGPDVLRMAPSLVIPRADLEDGLARLDAACAELVATRAAA